MPHRNIVFLFADQMHGFAMGCMGCPDVDTPELDRLAAEGTLFRTAYSNAPVCTPFRLNLLTGMYGQRIDGFRNRALIPPGVRTLADGLNDGGYRTGYVGKWHIGDSGNKAIPEELRGGFTEFEGYQCYNHYLEGVEFYDEAGDVRKFDYHRTDVTTDIALERLDGLVERDQPFALFVSYQNPHYPEQPDPEYYEPYRGRPMARRPNVEEVEPFIVTHSPKSPRPMEADPIYEQYGGDIDEYLRHYFAMVTQLDANVGRVLRALDERGLADDTLVVFTSDHGDLACSHGLTGKGVAYEESCRIPLIVRDPFGERGQVSDLMASGVDIYPTLLDWAGLPPESSNDGASFAPTLRGEQQDLERPVFSEMGRWCMVRQGGYKLNAAKPESGPGSLEYTELFDLDADPYEMTNLIDAPDLAEVRVRISALLDEWWSRVNPA